MLCIRRAECSDPLSPDACEYWSEVETFLSSAGETLSPTSREDFSGLWADTDWWLVADPSGGSRCLEFLPDFVAGLPLGGTDSLRRAWWSLSDNTLVLNTLLDRNLCRLLHGQPLTLAGRHSQAQRERFLVWSRAIRRGQPFPPEALPPLLPLRGSWEGPVTLVGGNLSALERLGTTPWRPRPRHRFLLVEGLSPHPDRAAHRVVALVGDPWWDDIAGLVVGRFSAADRDSPHWIDDCLSLLPPDLPVARLPLVGHGSDAWTIPLGEPVRFPMA